MYTSYQSHNAALPFYAQHILSTPMTLPRILLVEDNPMLQHIHQQYLENHGYKVTVASSGEKALLIINHRFDLVLMDIDLPGMNGLKTTKALLRRLSLPVIACTTHDPNKFKNTCLAHGMVDYLHKPILAADMITCLEKYLPSV